MMFVNSILDNLLDFTKIIPYFLCIIIIFLAFSKKIHQTFLKINTNWYAKQLRSRKTAENIPGRKKSQKAAPAANALWPALFSNCPAPQQTRGSPRPCYASM